MPVRDNANFYSRLRDARSANMSAACLETGSGAVYSFEQLDRLSARYAHALVALGCERGDRVAVQVEKSAQALALFLACLRAGLVYLPLNTAYQTSEVSHCLADAQPTVFICREEHRSALADLAHSLGVPGIEGLDQQGNGSFAALAAGRPESFETVHSQPTDTASIMYTSGTTGRAKGAMLSHRSVSFCAEGLSAFWGFTGEDVLLHALPIFHGHGLFVSTCVALMSGARLLFHSKFDVDAVIAALPRATVMMGVPTFYHRLLADARFGRESCKTLRLFTSGSAPLSAQMHQAFFERCGHPILERYGMTETMILTSNPLHGERRPGSVGLPLPGVALRIADQDDRPLGVGQVGMIQVRGDGLFSGYWRMEDKTAQEFTADGFFRTGDLGTRSDDGYISITGRAKDLIITGGYNVYPAEVEQLLDAHPAVSESAVIGVPHPDFGEAVTAVVIVRAEHEREGVASTLTQWLKARLANYKVPKQILVVEQLPRNTMGKVQKNVLREMFAHPAKPAADNA
jgi:malonyl-CoA/methylmalonyl-CoA synthetase